MNLAGPYWASTTTILVEVTAGSVVTKQAVATKSMVRQDLSVDVEYRCVYWLRPSR